MAVDASRRRWWCLAVLCLSLMSILVSNGILGIALPAIAPGSGATNTELQWIVDVYLLTFAGLLLPMGSLGDRFGRRGAWELGLVVFGTTSLVAAFMDSPTALIACRAVMGIGGALVMPATLSILTNVFTDSRDRGRAIGIWVGTTGLGSIFGPIVGGILLQHFWYGSLFLMNLPVVVLALIGGRRYVPTSRDPHARPLDVPGSVISVIALSLLLWGVIEGPIDGWGSAPVIGGLIGAIVAGAVFVWWERRVEFPLLEISLFRNPRFSIACVAVTALVFSMSTMAYLFPQYLQFVMGNDVLGAAYRQVPLAVTYMVAGPLAPRLVERIGSKMVLAGGMGVVGAVLLAASTLDVDTSYWFVAVLLAVLALGVASAFGPATDSIMGAVPKHRAGVGSAMNDATRQVGAALGIAIVGTMLVSGYRTYISAHAASLGVGHDTLERVKSSVAASLSTASHLGAAAGDRLADVTRRAFVHGMSLGFVLGGAVCLMASLAVIWRLPARELEAPSPEMVAEELRELGVVVPELA